MLLVGRGKEFEELGDGLHGGRTDGRESFGCFDPEPKIVVVQERFQSSDSGSSASAECGQGLASPVAGLEVLGGEHLGQRFDGDLFAASQR
jgi:hypothetical protein